MKTETAIPMEFRKGRVPTALYVQIEERLNARWAMQRKKDVIPEKSVNVNLDIKREDI